jgi:hypothetical protein
MANSKISALTSATTPLAGTETLPIVQSSATKQVSVANLTAGRAVTMLSNTMASASAVNDVDKTGGASYGYRMKGNDQANVRFRFENTGGQIYELVGGAPGASNSGWAIFDATAGVTRLQLSSAGAFGLGCTPGAIGGDLDVIGNQNGIGIGYSTLLYRRLIPQATNVLSFASAANTATLSAAGAWTNASDARLKKNITNIKYGLDTVMATQPRSYNRKDVPGEFIGFVAQELKNQVPEVVFGNEDEQYTVDYGSLVAIAFKAIQELKAEIEILKGGK